MSLKTLLKWLLCLMLMMIALVSIRYFQGAKSIAVLTEWIRLQGIWAPICFMSCYIFATVFLLPGAALTLVGGFIFGPYLGTLYSLSAAVIGATISFLLARYLLGNWLRSKISGQIDLLISNVEEQGWKFVAIVRLMPILPFNILNYALGCTRVKWLDYVWASFVFMLPGCMAYTYLGHLSKFILIDEKKALLSKIFIAFSLFVFLAVIPWIIKKWKKANEISS